MPAKKLSASLGSSVVRAGTSPSSVAVGDFNGDGKLDLVVANAGSNNISVLLGKGDGTFRPAVNYSAGTGPQSLVAGDFNGDGKLDVVVANIAGNVSILLGNGDGTFRAATNYPVGNSPSSVAVGDLNGDGKLDLVVTNSGAGNGVSSVSVLLGNGDGTFRAATNYNAGFGSLSVAVGDFNRDGRLDLAVVNLGDSDVVILLGKGDGTFQAPQTYPANAPTSVAVGDFNGDGNLDLAVANIVTNQGFGNVSVFLGKGDGTFQPATDFVIGSNPNTVALGDFNGDGKLDIAVANYGGYGNAPSVSVLLGDGDGTFQPAVDYGTGAGAYGSSSLAVGDLNGDGRLDVAVGDGASGASTISVLLQPQLVTGADAALDPANLTFPTQLVGTTSAVQSVLLVNYGTMTLSIAGISTSSDFTQTHTCGSSLAPGAGCTISAAFAPVQGGTRPGTLSVTDNAPGSPQTMSLSGTGTVVELSPSDLRFSCFRFCSPYGCHCICSRPETTTLSNVGRAALDITDITISGPFSQTNTCGTRLGAGNSCSIGVNWLRATGSGEVSVSDDGGGSPQTVSLSGNKQCSPLARREGNVAGHFRRCVENRWIRVRGWDRSYMSTESRTLRGKGSCRKSLLVDNTGEWGHTRGHFASHGVTPSWGAEPQ